MKDGLHEDRLSIIKNSNGQCVYACSIYSDPLDSEFDSDYADELDTLDEFVHQRLQVDAAPFVSWVS